MVRKSGMTAGSTSAVAANLQPFVTPRTALAIFSGSFVATIYPKQVRQYRVQCPEHIAAHLWIYEDIHRPQLLDERAVVVCYVNVDIEPLDHRHSNECSYDDWGIPSDNCKRIDVVDHKRVLRQKVKGVGG
jgi:hypothetical protein